jgi:hypothetical protein
MLRLRKAKAHAPEFSFLYHILNAKMKTHKPIAASGVEAEMSL